MGRDGPVTLLMTTTHNRNDSRPEINSHVGWGAGREARGTRSNVQNTVAPFLFQTNKTRREHAMCPDLGVGVPLGGKWAAGGWDVVIFHLCCWKLTHA